MKNVELIKIPYGTKDWYRWRNDHGLGGSEVPILFGFHSRYSSQAKLYNVKIGRFKENGEDSEATFWGRELEKIIKQKWTYYEPANGYLDNHKNKKVIREFQEVEAFAVNSKYPYLFASVDGLIKDGFSLINGEKIPLAVLECKTSTSLALSHYQNGIDPAHIFQIHVYFLVYELDYGEIVLLKDGRYLSVLPIERNEHLIEKIQILAQDFWFNKVIPGKEAYALFQDSESRGDLRGMSHYQGIIDRLEPMGDGGDGYTDFLNERWRETNTRAAGDYRNYNRAKLDKKYLEIMKLLNKERQKNIQMIRRDLHLQAADYFDFPEGGYYRVYRRGEDVVTYNRIKFVPDSKLIDGSFKRMLREVL